VSGRSHSLGDDTGAVDLDCLDRLVSFDYGGGYSQRCQDRDLLARPAPLHQLRRLAARRPGPAGQRGHQQAALVDQDEIGVLSSGLF
jgi:hypothetical protein